MGSYWIWAIAAVVGVYAAFCMLLYAKQRQMMYLPTAGNGSRECGRNPAVERR